MICSSKLGIDITINSNELYTRIGKLSEGTMLTKKDLITLFDNIVLEKKVYTMTKEAYEYLHKIIAGRAHPDSGRDRSAQMAYTSCLWMLEYAHDGNIKALKNFDYGEHDSREDNESNV